jgi:hypothetical protein
MVQVTSDGKTLESKLPDSIKEKILENKVVQENLDLDRELVLKSENPEIQALVRLLGWKK